MAPFEVEITTEDVATAALCRDYWAVDDEQKFPVKVADLAERYQLRPHDVARVVRDGSVVRSTETRCAGCGEGMEFASRADFQQRRSWYRNWNRPFVCEPCSRESARIRAREAEEREGRQRAALIEWFALADGGALDVDEFGLEQGLGLLSVIRAGATEDLAEIVPAESWSSPLAPTVDLENEVIKELFESRILAISETSPVDAFEWDELDPGRFFRMKVGWHVTDGAGAAVPIADAASELERRFRDREWPDHWHKDLRAIWLKLALHECLRYLDLGLADHGLQKRIGEKTVAVVTNALHDFSIGQVYNFIWRAVRDAAAYYMRGGVGKQQAANTVVRAIERSAEQALTNGWDVKVFHRDWRAPESVMAQTFAGIVTALGDAYWSTAPHELPAPAPGVAAAS
jgi:hypothetical protein